MQHTEPRLGLLKAFRHRMREALCLSVEPVGVPADGSVGVPAGHPAEMPAGRSGPGAGAPWGEQGSAVVEFTFLAVLLMVPVVYFVVTVGQIQGGSFAVVGAADQAAKVFVARGGLSDAGAAAERAVFLALGDYGHAPDKAKVEVSCDRADCLSAGARVTVKVTLDVPLPLMPFGDTVGLNAARLSASATQVVGRFL
ncbi:hypothetical protein [Arthrobacter sp. YN]|uniref:hypothetical protein n=1 Tax=Arthrobacter sp. YN TaxID=2020486 RepID=UPI000B5ED8D3|nr:hypothetical protein [Arthrobacter sp. YN]ASN20910.1 hypothetical protein CGK93_15410 [Arthrobacter sp. YN]